MGLRPAKSHEKLSGRRLADEILWGRLVTCGRLAIGPCRLRGGPAAVTNRRAGCQPAPHWFFDPANPLPPVLLTLSLADGPPGKVRSEGVEYRNRPPRPIPQPANRPIYRICHPGDDPPRGAPRGHQSGPGLSRFSGPRRPEDRGGPSH